MTSIWVLAQKEKDVILWIISKMLFVSELFVIGREKQAIDKAFLSCNNYDFSLQNSNP